ncbi:MAG: hypothetical protein HQL01_01835 [Nitrospirae bacterium]|nr:hypothetical protein [Nitrospirota bacterium]
MLDFVVSSPGSVYSKKAAHWLLLLLVAIALTVTLPSPGFSELKKGDSKKAEKKTEKKGPSKEEAIAYIQERCTIDNDNAQTKDTVSLDGCTFISETAMYDRDTYVHRRSVPLETLNPDRFTNGVWPSTNAVKFGIIGNSVSYATSDEKPHVKFVIERKKEGVDNIEKMENYGFFQCFTEQMAAEAAKALRHLAILCGAKKPVTPYD